MRLRWLGFVMLFVGLCAHAQTRYVSDRTIVELRRGPSTEYLILRNLEAGQRVEVLEQDADAGYSRVKVGDEDLEGWILTRYLTPEPIARDRLAVSERNLTTTRQRVAELETANAGLTANLEATRAELAETASSRGAATRELEDIRTAAANVVEIRDQNTRLQQRLNQRDREVEQLTAENARLAARNDQNWFIVGAAVLLVGIVIGLVAPSLRRRRRSNW